MSMGKASRLKCTSSNTCVYVVSHPIDEAGSSQRDPSFLVFFVFCVGHLSVPLNAARAARATSPPMGVRGHRREPCRPLRRTVPLYKHGVPLPTLLVCPCPAQLFG